MADLAYSAAIQDRIALKLTGKAYSGLLSNEKALIDNTWASGAVGGVAGDVLTLIQQRSQFFYMAGAANAPDVWAHIWVAGVVAKCCQTLRPERAGAMWKEYSDAWAQALDSFTLDDVVGSAVATPALHFKGLRFYCMDKTARMSPRRFFSTAAVDEATSWVLNYAFNHAPWRLRTRQARMAIRVLTFEDAVWTESSKTLTLAATFSAEIAAGDRVRIIGGTADVQPGDYIAASGTSGTVVLTTSLSRTAQNIATVDGAVTYVRFVGLGAGETFDSHATRNWYFEATRGGRLQWCSQEQMAEYKAAQFDDTSETNNLRQPIWFSMEERTAYKTFYFSPEPDQDYFARGAVYIAGPPAPSASTDTAPFLVFPAAMRPHMRDLVLGRLLGNHAGTREEGGVIWRKAMEDIDRLFPAYEDPGEGDNFMPPTDRNDDVAAATGGDSCYLGGRM